MAFGISLSIRFFEYAMRSLDFKNHRKGSSPQFGCVPPHVMVTLRKRLKEVCRLDCNGPDNFKQMNDHPSNLLNLSS